MVIISKYSQTIEYNLRTTLDSSGISKLQAELSKVLVSLQEIGNKELISNNQFKEAETKIRTFQSIINSSFNSKLGLLDMKSVNQGLKTANLSLSDLHTSLSKAGTIGENSFNRIIGTFGRIDEKAKNVSKTTDKIFNTLGNTVRWGLIASGFQSVMNSVHQASEYVKDLDTSLTNIMMVTDYSRDAMNDYAKSANEAAKALGSTTVAMTDATLVFAQQGFDLNKSDQLAQLSTKLANASQQDTATTSDQITAYMNAYGMDDNMEQLSLALDKWAEVANISAADVQELATASQKAASTANTVGVNMDQLAAQVATIESVTREAPENIGNGLKTLYARFSDLKMGETLDDGVDLKQVSTALSKVGVDVLDSEGKMKNIGDVMEELMRVWTDLDQTQKAAIATTVAGKFQLARFEALMNRSDLYQEYKSGSENAEGTLDTMNEKFVNSLQGKMNTLQATTEGIMSNLFESSDFYGLIDALTQIVDLMNQFINAVGGGSSALTLLGSTALRVFNTQIGRGLSNFISNRQGNFKERQNLVEKQKILNQFGATSYNELNDKQKEIFNFVQAGVDNAKYMSTEQARAYKDALEETINTTERLDNRTEDLRITLGATEQAFALMGNKYKLMTEDGKLNIDELYSDILSNPEGMKTSLQELQENNLGKHQFFYQQLAQNMNQLSELQHKAFSTEDIDEQGTHWEKFGNIVENIKQKLESLESTGQIAAGLKEQLQEILVDLTRVAHGAEGYTSSEVVQGIIQRGQNLGLFSDRMFQQIQEGNFADNPEAIQKIVQQYLATKSDEAYLDQIFKRNQGMQEQWNSQKVFSGITNTIGAVGQLAFAWQSFQNLGSLWANSELSDTERNTQMIMDLAMSLPMAMSSLSQLHEGIGSFAEGLGATEKIAGKVSIVGTVITGVIATVITAISTYQQAMAQLREEEIKTAEEIRDTTSTQTESYNEWEQLYQEYKKTGVASEEFIESSKNIAKTLGSASDEALAAASSYETLAASMAKVNENSIKDTIEANNAVIYGQNGKSFRGEEGFNDSAASDIRSKILGVLNSVFNKEGMSDIEFLGGEGGGITQTATAAGIAQLQYLGNLVSGFDQLTNDSSITEVFSVLNQSIENTDNALQNLSTTYDEYLQKNADSPDLKSKESWDAEKQSLQEMQEALSDLRYQDDIKAIDDALKSNADLATQLSDFNQKIQAAGTDIKKIKSVFSEDSLIKDWFGGQTELQQLDYMISHVTDSTQKLILSAAKAEIELKKTLNNSNLSEQDQNELYQKIRKVFNDQNFVDFVGQLDVPLTKDNIDNQIKSFLDNQFQLNLIASLDTSELKEAQSKKSDFQDLIDKYTEAFNNKGGFDEDEAASIISSNPEFLEFLTKIGDQYVLNDRALAEWNDRVREQTKAISELRGETIDLTDQNKTLNNILEGEYGEIGDQLKDTLSGIKELNLSMMNGEISNSQFLEGLTSNFEKLTSVIQQSGQAFSDFIQDASNANIITALTDELYQGMKQANRQFQSGATNLSDYGRAVQTSAKQSLKLLEAQSGLTEEQIKSIKEANNYEEALKNVNTTQKDSASEIRKISDEIESLDKALNFSDVVRDNYEDLIQIFDNSGNVLNSALQNGMEIADQYKTVISQIAASVSSMCTENEAMATSLANNIAAVTQTTQQDALAMVQNVNDLTAAMMSNSEVASAVMQSGMSETEAAIGELASGIAGIISSIMSMIGNIDASVEGTPEASGESVQQWSFTNPANNETVTGELRVPGFKMHIQGSGSGISGGTSSGTSVSTYKDSNGNLITKVSDYQSDSEGPNSGLAVTRERTATTQERIDYHSGEIARGISALTGGSSKGLKGYAPVGTGSNPSSYGSSGSGSGGGGGGGGGKGYEGPTPKDPIEEDPDRYEKVNVELERLAKALEKVAKAQDRVTALKYADNLDAQTKILQKQIDKYEEKLALQRQEAAELKNSLGQQYGVTFDTETRVDVNGNKITEYIINNYAETLKKLEAEVNSAIAKYNASGSEDEEKANQKAIDAAQKRLNDFKKDYKRYDELMSSEIAETEANIQDCIDKAHDFRLELFKTAIEGANNLKELNEAFMDFKNNLHGLNRNDPLKQAQLSVKKLGEYWDSTTISAKKYYKDLDDWAKKRQKEASTDAEKQGWQNYRNALKNAQTKQGNGTLEAGGTGYFDYGQQFLDQILAQVDQYNKTGTSDWFGSDDALLYEALEEALKYAEETLDNYVSETENLRDSIKDAVDDMNDKFERRIKEYQNIVDDLEHDLNVYKMLHGDKNYAAENEALIAQNAATTQQILELQEQIATNKAILDSTDPETQKEQWQDLNDKIADCQSQINDLVETTIERLRQAYENTVNKVLDQWTKAAFGTDDLDWIQEEWELINRNADYYLDDINKAFNIQKLQGKYLELLDNASGLHIQKKISDQMAQQLSYLREKTHLSQYDVQYAEMQLEILQKQIALEEAQRNKSQMKLKRDSQGNYKYVYTANDDDLASKEQDLLEAQNNAYNLSKDAMIQAQNDALAAQVQARQALFDIWTDANLTLEEKEKHAEEIINNLNEYLSFTAEQLGTSQQNLLNDTVGMIELLSEENAQYLEYIYQQLMDGNDDAYNQIDARFSSSLAKWLQNNTKFKTDTEAMYAALIANGQNYAENVDQFAQTIGQNFDDISSHIQTAKKSTDDLVESTGKFRQLISDMQSDITGYNKTLAEMNGKITAAEGAMQNYAQATEEAYKNLAQNAATSTQVSSGGVTTVVNKEVGGVTVKQPASGGGGGGGGGGGASDKNVEGIAGNIWVYGGWGNDPTRHALMRQKFGDAGGDKVYNAVQYKFNHGYGYNGGLEHDWGYYKSFYPSNFLSGGYTGTWGDSEGDQRFKNGKLAYLHQKELILNESDTLNMLKAVESVRKMTDQLKSGAFDAVVSKLNVFGSQVINPDQQGDLLEQNVHITAEFPAANSADEIKAALLSLNDTALQYVRQTR